MALHQWVRILMLKPLKAKVLLFVWNIRNETRSDAVLPKNVVQYGGSSFHSLLSVALVAFTTYRRREL
jgi:hypothetical protein